MLCDKVIFKDVVLLFCRVAGIVVDLLFFVKVMRLFIVGKVSSYV